MFLLLQTAFLKGPALVSFTNVIIRRVIGPDDALQLLEAHFSDDCAKQVNDDVWLELSFDLIKLKRALRNEKVTHEKVLNELCTQISELADTITGSGHSSDVMTKNIAAVRCVEAFEPVYRNSLKNFTLSTALYERALKWLTGSSKNDSRIPSQKPKVWLIEYIYSNS